MESTLIAWKGHGQPPFGYSYNKKEKKLVINLEQAKHLKEIFAFALKKRASFEKKSPSLHEIAQYLNDKKVLSSRGKKWSYKTVRYLFEAEKLKFYSGYKNEQPGEWESIIDGKTAQKLIDKNVFSVAEKPRPRTRVYLLTDLDVLKCGSCGSSVKAARSITPKRENLYYRCAAKTYRGKDACSDSKVWPMEAINNLVVNDLVVHISNAPEKIEKYTKQFEAKRNKEAEESINKISQEIIKIIDKQNSSTDVSDITELNKKLTSKLEEKNRLLTLKQSAFDTRLVWNKAKKLNTLSVEDQKGLIKRLVKKITLSKEKLIIDYNFCFAPNKYSQILLIK